MRSRWSPAIFDPGHHLADEEALALTEAARWAPSFGNTQPAGFVYLRRGSSAHTAFCGLLSRGNSLWVPRASAVFLAATQLPDPHPADDKAPIPEHYSYYDLGQAVTHLVLQATATGLHCHQFAGFDHAAAAELLGLPDTVRAPVGVAVGTRGDASSADDGLRRKDQRERTRKPLGELVHHGYWGRRTEDTSVLDE